MNRPACNQPIRNHPLTLLLWEPLRRAILAIRARNPAHPRTEVVNEAASVIFDDPQWRSAIDRELKRVQAYTEEEAFSWMCYLAQHVWEQRHGGDLRIQIRVRREGVSVERILPPLTEAGNPHYEQRLLNQSPDSDAISPIR